MPNQMRPCRRCAFWSPMETGTYAGRGSCHCHPPAFWQPDAPAVWPITEPEDWCGDGAPLLPKE